MKSISLGGLSAHILGINCLDDTDSNRLPHVTHSETTWEHKRLNSPELSR